MTRTTRVMALAAMLLPQLAHGGEIAFTITGVIEFVFDPAGRTGLNAGDAVTGSVTFDGSVADSNGDPTTGFYSFNTAPSGMTLSAGAGTVSTVSGDGAFSVLVRNDDRDVVAFQSWSNSTAFGEQATFMYWALADDSAAALSSDALPSGAPALVSFNFNSMGFDLADGTMVRMRATSAQGMNFRPPPANAKAFDHANGHSAVMNGIRASDRAEERASANAAFKR